MADKKADTTISELAAAFVIIGGDPAMIKKLVDHTQPKPKSRRRKMPKTDPNINKTFKIKRINYSVFATINPGTDNLYKAIITSIDKGVSPFEIGENFLISKRELELTGIATGSK